MADENPDIDFKAAAAYDRLAGPYDPETRLTDDEQVALDKLEAGHRKHWVLKDGEMVEVTNETE